MTMTTPTTTTDLAPDPRRLVGPEHGATQFMLQRADMPAGAYIGLHVHDGEEANLVLSGQVRFTVAGRQWVCGPGEAAFAPTGVEHGFRVLSDATIVTVREQRLGTRVIVFDPDGTRREVATYRHGPPWSNEPPPGVGVTPNAELERLYESTAHLL